MIVQFFYGDGLLVQVYEEVSVIVVKKNYANESQPPGQETDFGASPP